MHEENESLPVHFPGADSAHTPRLTPLWSDQLLLQINHEIRTAVNSILGQMELLQESPLTRDQLARVAAAQTSAGQLLGESAKILDLARMELGSLLPRRIRFNPRETLRQTLDLLSPLALAQGVTFQTHVPNELPAALLGDPDRISQIVVALVRHGMERIGKGKISVRVEHYAGSLGEAILKFTVVDSGPPIPPAILGHLFDGSDVHGTAAQNNPKLVLSFSKRLAEIMGGALWVGEAPESGMAFHFNVKLRVVHPHLAAVDGGTEPEARSPARPLNILLAEDSTDNVALIQAFIKDEPWRLDTAANGRIAIERAATSTYDLILMDLDMPEMDGYTAARRIRISECRDETPTVPIVALTAHNEAEAALKSLEAGCTAHVTKPISKGALIQTIRQYAQS